MLYVELDEAGTARHLHYAPYLDYRPLEEGEPDIDTLLALPQSAWITRELESTAQAYAVAKVVPEHLNEVRACRQGLLDKTEAAVKDRLTKEINYLAGSVTPTPEPDQASRLALAAKARESVTAIERDLGFDPIDQEAGKLGYDVESRMPGTGRLRFIEVKGRIAGAQTITVTRNETLHSLNKPEEYILAIVLLDGDNATPYYLRSPFRREPDFAVTSVSYDLKELVARAHTPR
ncbi:MAG: DUF3883 domain-containing protein [Chromatiaceae bacterium]